MAQFNLTSLPTKSLLRVFFFGGGILLFVLLAILPSLKESKALDNQIVDINARIKEQELLSPVYDSLLKKSKTKPPLGLNVVPLKKLKRNETDKVAQVFLEMARQSKLQLTDYAPEIQSLIGDTETMKVNVLLKGEFIDLQPFLNQLSQLPYLVKMEEITIKSVKDTKEMHLRLWLARE